MRHIVSFSTGIPSAIVAYLICQQHPDTVVLFADVLWEDEDNYRFYNDVQRLLDRPIHNVSGGLSPLEIADNEGYSYIPNQRTATCTRKGKIQVIKDFMRDGDILYLGMTHVDKNNGRDLDAPIRNWSKIGVTVRYPLIEQNIEPHGFAKELGLEPPRMYSMGYKHANCGGRCVKQGRGDWVRTLVHFPERYSEVEEWETSKRLKQATRIIVEMALCASIDSLYLLTVNFSKLYTIVRKVIDGINVGISLSSLKAEYQNQHKHPNFFDMVDELNGYGCTVDCGIGDINELELVFQGSKS